MRTKSHRYSGRPEHERLKDAIQRARLAAGLSQRQLSKKLGMHPMTIMRYEQGERSLDVMELIDIASVLGLDPADLVRSATT